MELEEFARTDDIVRHGLDEKKGRVTQMQSLIEQSILESRRALSHSRSRSPLRGEERMMLSSDRPLVVAPQVPTPA
jgi:hypothetical protein